MSGYTDQVTRELLALTEPAPMRKGEVQEPQEPGSGASCTKWDEIPPRPCSVCGGAWQHEATCPLRSADRVTGHPPADTGLDRAKVREMLAEAWAVGYEAGLDDDAYQAYGGAPRPDASNPFTARG